MKEISKYFCFFPYEECLENIARFKKKFTQVEDWSQIFVRFNRLFVVLCQKRRSGEKNIAVCHRIFWEGNL